MSATASHHYFRDQHCDFQADQASIEALLNCYCRDIAGPAGELSVQCQDADQSWPQAIHVRLALGSASVLQVRFPDTDAHMLVLVAGHSRTCNYRYLSAPFYKSALQGWQVLGLEHLARLLLGTLANRFEEPFNGELYRQILLSRQVMQAILAYTRVPADWGKSLTAFRWSEQALAFGHRFHPAPKAREGFDAEDVLQFSPEMGAGFALYYFAITPADLRTQGNALEALASESLPADLELPAGFIPMPVHPWQARYLLRQPLVRQSIRAGRIVPLGPAGPQFFPTASVRTLYQPGNPFFFKFSTHVRLTNCIRKNAFYELESAVALSTALQRHLVPKLFRWPAFHLLYEPAYATLDFADHTEHDRRELMEGFGVILRESVENRLRPGVTPLLAASLFTDDRFGHCPARASIETWGNHIGLNPQQAACQWFDRYLGLLVPPLLDSLFHYGVAFEPHLQNVVVGLGDGYPEQIFVRDLEGTKLVPGLWSGQLPDTLDSQTVESMYYSRDKAWNRIAYCLLVNHLFQVVACLCDGNDVLESSLWSVLDNCLANWMAGSDNPWAHETLTRLRAGDPIPNKSNLMTRLFKRPDRESGYTEVANPLAGPGPVAAKQSTTNSEAPRYA